jgi:hypothetical protein
MIAGIGHAAVSQDQEPGKIVANVKNADSF